MKFEDAQDIAYRFAQAAYIRKLRKLIGEAELLKLAGSFSRHSALLVVNDSAFTIQVTIMCGAAGRADRLEDVIKRANKVVPSS